MNRLACLAALTAALAAAAACAAAQPGTASATVAATAGAATPRFTAAQAMRGEAVYRAHCVACHGDNLDDGQFAAALKGPAFTDKWGGKGLDGLFAIMTTQMPPTNPGGLGAQAYADVLAFVMASNRAAPGAVELPADPEQLKLMVAPG